ncbi:MAG: YhbY family RNA-binding protein [Coprobacillus sp.]|nr:YhbY family RNA-binding protein [Coprobacillus sp.]
MLNKRQKSYLRSESNKLKNKYQIGKNEITDQVIEMLDEGLKAHELIKVSLLKTVSLSANGTAIVLAQSLNAEIVQVIGRVITLYRANKDNPMYKINKL